MTTVSSAPARAASPAPSAPCVLGIDSGGTKCEALVTTIEGMALGWGRCDVRHPRSGRAWGGSGRSGPSVIYATQDALRGVACDGLIAGYVGFGTPGTSPSDIGARVTAHVAVREYDTAFALADEPCGMVALSGTGAFVFCRTPDGRTAYLDGMGPALGDYGSGYAIGAQALRAAARSHWGPAWRTDLATAVAHATGCASLDSPRGRGELIQYAHGHRDRGEISDLARLAIEASDAGDAVAQRIVDQAAADLAGTLRAVVERIAPLESGFPLIGAGGVIAHSTRFWDRFCAEALRIAPALRPVRLTAPLVMGAVLCALREQGHPAGPQVRDTMAASLATVRKTSEQPHKKGAHP